MKQKTHECCPKEWRKVPNLTGDYDLDATIAHRKNGDMPHRLALYVSNNAYGPKTAYRGYTSGDD